MPALIAIALLLAGFFAGAIPTGYLLARAKGIDIRTRGSGNIGATNVGRVLGRPLGFLCFALDFLKALVPTVLAGLVVTGVIANPLHDSLGRDAQAAVWLGVAGCAVLGHMFTPFLGFKGGKGIAAGFGGMLGVYPVLTIAALIAITVWLITVRLTRMMGISSVTAAITLTLVVVASYFAPASINDRLVDLGIYRRATGVEAVFVVGLCALVIFKHRGNIARTIKGTEPKIGHKKPA